MQKCYYLHDVLDSALTKFPCETGITWGKCCDEIVAKLRETEFLSLPPLESSRILQNWLNDFRKYGRKLVVPSIVTPNVITNIIPPLLQVYPDFYHAVIEFCNLNIGEYCYHPIWPPAGYA